MTPNPLSNQYHFYCGQALPEAWPYAYHVAAEGVFKVVHGRHFRAAFQVAAGRVAGLSSYPDAGVLLTVPRIPAGLLARVLAHARDVCLRASLVPVEQMYHFHYFHGVGWRVAVPRQQAGAGRVAYTGGCESSVVLDLHSHHEMAAFFSETDDRDEQGCRFYAVIGRIFTQPDIRLRLGVYGDFLKLPAAFLFDGLGPFRDRGAE